MARIISYFVDQTFILKYYSGFLDNNIDPNLFNQFIFIAQEQNIQEILGYTLYIKYLTDIANTGSPDPTGLYKDLMDQCIQDATALWAIYHAIPTMNFRLTNKAMSQKSSDNSTPSAVSEVEYIRNQVRNMAEFKCARIREYIINNLNSFPEYVRYNGIDRIIAKPNNYFGGIALGTTRGFYNSKNDPYFGGPCCD